MKWLSAVVPFVVALPLLILAAFLQGKETERWGEIPEMKQFAERLQQLPLDIGPWHGKRGAGLSATMQKAAGAEGDTQIVYTNEITGKSVDMFIVVGRLLDVSKHRPDRCYPAQGYKPEGDEAVLQKVTTAANSKVEFRTALYTKEEQDYKTRIYWSWASDGVWKGPDGEDGLRKEFRRTRPIYKMYVDNPVGKTGEHADDQPSIDLIKVLVPAYNKVLFPSTESASSTKSPPIKSTSAKSTMPPQKPVARGGGAGVAFSERATSSGSIA
jgi:hypothetical protein